MLRWGVLERSWHHRNSIDCLGMVGQRDKPCPTWGAWIQPPAAGGERQTRSYPPGVGLAAMDAPLPPLNIWYNRSPKIDHFLLPSQRKRRWKEAQSQPGRIGARKGPYRRRVCRQPLAGSQLHILERDFGTKHQSQAGPKGSVLQNTQRTVRVLCLPAAPREQKPTSALPSGLVEQNRTLPPPKPALKAAPTPRGSGCDRSSPAFSGIGFTNTMLVQDIFLIGRRQ